MASYDDIVKKNKDYLTQAQINALASASQEYNIANAGNRAGALQTAREQYDASYRGLQNMGLAGNQNAAPTSGEVPRLQMKIKTPFDSYNDRLKQVEHQRLGILGEQFKQETIAQREAEAAARRAQEEARRRAQLQAAAQTLQSKALNVASVIMNRATGSVMKAFGSKLNLTGGGNAAPSTPVATEQYSAPIGPMPKQQAQEQQQRRQEFNSALAAADVLKIKTPDLPAQIKSEKTTDAYKSAVVDAALNSRKDPGAAWKNTPKEQKQVRQVVNQSASVLTTGQGFDAETDKKVLADAQTQYDNLRWKAHYGGKVDPKEMQSARDAVSVARMKVEQPETFASLVVYNDAAQKGTPAYDKAIDIVANEEAKALIQSTHGRAIDTSMTFDEYEKAGQAAPKIRPLIERYDFEQKALAVATQNKMIDAVAEHKANIASIEKEIAELGYTVDQARNIPTDFKTERDIRSELEYYRNALAADMRNDGNKPTKAVNKDETDVIYRAVNDLPDIMRKKDRFVDYLPGAMSNAAFTDQSLASVAVQGKWMTIAQINAYNYLYETQGIDAANAYIDSIRPLINIERARQDEKYAKELANDPVASNLLSIPMRAAGSIPAALEKLIVGGANAINDMRTGGTGTRYYLDTNDAAHQMANIASTIRSETSQRILEANKDNPKAANLWLKSYQIGMSTLDSGFNMAFGIAGAPWVTTLLAGSDAANETFKDVRARGGTQEQAMTLSCLSAIAESLFERVSLEYFTNNWIEKGAKWTRPFLVKWGLGAGVEGSEEVFTSIANLLSDVYVMHDKSEWKQLVAQKGMKRALLDEIKNIGEEGLAGFISGGIFGLFGGAFNAARSYSETTSIGKQAKTLGLDQKYKDMATVFGGKAGKTAAKLGDNPSNHQVGKLVTQVNQQLAKTFTGNETTDIPMALLFSGKQLSFTEANDVYQALGSEKLTSMGYEADSARAFMNSYNQRMVDSGIFNRMQEQLKQSNENRANVEAEEYLSMTDQLGGTEYNEKNVAAQKAMRESLEKRVWKNPNAGIAVTDDGEEVMAMPGNMTRVGWAEMNRRNFKAQSTVSKGRTTYELSSMAMREGMTAEEAYAAMRENMQDDAKKSADFYEKLADSLGLDIVIHDVMRGSNGFLKDGKLHVVLSSRQNAVRIASHELTHYMKAHSPAKFTKLVENLIREVGQKEFDRQVADKAAFYGFDVNSKSGIANAREEVCAELCERMLSNEDMLARFAQRETDTARTMKSHLEQTVDAIRNALTGDEKRDFGKSNSSLIKAVETMDSWIDGLTDAIANAEAQKQTMMGQVAITAGVTESDHNRLIDKLSKTETEEEFDDVFAEFSVDVIEYDLAGYMQDLLKNNIMSVDEVTELFDTMTDAIDMVKAHRAILDFGFQLSEEAQNDPDLVAQEIAEAKANRPYLPYKQNADPHYKIALDFSTLCKKRILLQMIQERLQGKLGRALSALETIAVRREIQKLQRNGVDVEVACALCYVESARLKSPKVINEFLGVGLDAEARARNVEEEMKNYFAQKDKDIKKDIEKAQRDWKVKKLGENWRGVDKKGKSITAAKATKDHLKAFGGQALVDEYNQYSKDLRTGRTGNIVNESLKANQQQVIRDAIDLVQKSPETFLSAESLAQLKLDHPDIFYAFTNKVRSATRSKALETDTFYSRGDISMFEEGIIRAANNESGFRHQSWSDFMPIHLLDTMASIIEMSTRDAKMHAYTKVPDMVRLLGKTGMMLNMSLIPKGDTGLNADGTLAWDSTEGMDWEVMKKLRRDFANTAGNIAIGISDEQIRLLLESPDIDYVIPYHVSGLNKELRGHMGIHAWLDFTSSQNESVAEGKAPSGKSWKEEHKSRKMKPPALNAWFDEKSAKAAGKNGVQYMQQAAQKYLDICARDGWVPKFSQYLDYDKATNKYTTKEGYENYWKTLIDRKMVNQETGEIIIQQAVKPKFNQDTVMSILSGEVSNPTAIRNAAAADEIAGELGKTWRGDRENANLKSYKKELSAFREASAVMAADRVKNAVKKKLEQTSFSIDDEYMELADKQKNGKLKKAEEKQLRKMVDDAAKEAFPGSLLIQDGEFNKMWHHTSKEFNEFLPATSKSSGGLKGIYFTPNEYGAVTRSLGDIHKEYYLNVENAKIAYGVKEHKEFVDKLKAMQEGVEDREQLAEVNRKFREETGIDAFVDPFNGWYNVLDPSLIKSADLVTYDDNGNIIPLSERFRTDRTGEDSWKNEDIRYSLADEELANKLDKEETVKVYRAMQVIDGKLYPPMAAKVAEESGGKRQLVEPTEIGKWYVSEERPDLIDPKTGKWKLDKANGSAIEAAYNPYFHTSLSALNDQFSSAYKRPNLVVVEGYVPKSELTSGYKAQYAKDSVGAMRWHSGPVSSHLSNPRTVILSRYFKANRILSDAEVAKEVAALVSGENVSIPENTVTPGLYSELQKLGVPTTPMFSIDDETPSQYSDERIEQYVGVSEFLDQISKGDNQLRERLLSALMPVIEANISAAERRATESRTTSRTTSRPAAKPGMKPPRENRVRDVDVPRRASTGDPVSDFVSNFLSSDKASDEIVAELEEKIQNGEWGTYAKLTNAEAVQRARDYISRRSISQAQSEFHDMVASGRFNVHTRALGLQLLAEAAARGDKVAVLDIASDLRELATDAGQSVQIFNVLNGLGGLGSAWHMQRKIDQLNSKYAQEISDGKMKEITVDSDLMQALTEAKTTEEISKAEDEIAKAIALQLPLTWASRLSNWRYLAMLGNPTTHFRNITGNVFMAALNTTKDAVATGLEKLAVRDVNERAHAVLTLADRQMWGDFVQKSYESSEKALRGSGKFGFETQLRQYMRSFDNKALDKIAQFNFDRLEQEDIWFIRPAYKNALMQYLKAQGYTLRDGVAGKMVNGSFQEITVDKMNAAVEWASNQAWKATFRDASAVADMLNTASRRLGPVGNVLIEGVMPFKKTPINIAKRGIEYSPAGIIMGLAQLHRDVKTGKVTKAHAIDNIASGIVGSALMAFGAALAKAGFIRAGGDDKKKVETYLTDTGEQTYSLKFGDVSINISALAPSTIPLFMGAALFDALDKNGEGLNMSALTETMASTLNPFMEMSVMSSLNSALKNYNNNGIGGALGNTVMTAVESYGSQFLPTAVGKLGQFADPTLRTTKSSAASPIGSGLDYYGRSLVKKIPGATALLQPDVNVWGRTTKKDTFQKWALDFANKFVFPVTVKVAQKDAIDDELIRIVESTGNVDVLPSDGAKSFTVNNEKYPMTAAQYTEFSKDRGNASYAALKETMLSSAYQQVNDEEKAEMLQNALAAAQKQVNTVWKEKLGALSAEDTTGDYSDPGLYKVAASYKNMYDKAAQASAKGVSPDTFLSLLDKKETYVGDDRSDYVRQEIMNSDLTPEQKEMMDDLIVSNTGRNPDYSSQTWFEISSISESEYKKAKSAEKLGVKPETYLSLYNKKKNYTGEKKTDYMRNEIMKSGLSAKQKAALDDAIISDKDRTIDYSSQAWFDVSMLGKTYYEEAKLGEKVGVKPETYLRAYKKYKEVNAKDKDGKYINSKKQAKKLLKEYLDGQVLSAPAYDFIWINVFNQKKK